MQLKIVTQVIKKELMEDFHQKCAGKTIGLKMKTQESYLQLVAAQMMNYQ